MAVWAVVKIAGKGWEWTAATGGAVIVPVSYTHLDVYKRQILCAFKFDILVTIVSLFNLGLYSLIMISQMVLRRKEPDLPRPYKIRLGKVGTDIFCTIPIIVAFIALFINGTDYFVMGLLGMISGPVAYIVFKRIYGGLYKNDPVKYPINKKTKLAVGDTRRIAFAFGLLAVLTVSYTHLDVYKRQEYSLVSVDRLSCMPICIKP